jgi:hypothetical protein
MREERQAGATPDRTAVAMEINMVPHSTRASTEPSMLRGSVVVGRKAARPRAVQTVVASATRPPVKAMRKFSTMSCRMSVARLAPTERRIASSRRRPTERTRTRLATLAEASSKSTAASASRMGSVPER